MNRSMGFWRVAVLGRFSGGLGRIGAWKDQCFWVLLSGQRAPSRIQRVRLATSAGVNRGPLGGMTSSGSVAVTRRMSSLASGFPTTRTTLPDSAA